MLRSLRGPDGGPGLATRLLAAVVAGLLLVIAAPHVLVPALRWLVHLVF
ncbi:hypothetical protein [Motilibacter deserti]|uniref:Uncharacterized protein n=1 Tax=Motilibacter deserti TaxID=2714956 RepID=A0ABX0GYT1_9ACTN|nr:hypothetical protein [Motilibacter deserti]NHC15967.1 hypothetical protein [Motilibacter deserti]